MLKLISKRNQLAAGIVLVIFFTIIYTSCDITNPTKSIAVIFNTLSISTTASVNFVDAATNLQIGSASQKDINVTFSGRDKDKIVSLRAEPVSSVSTNFGVVTFGINPDYTPTPQNPIKIVLTVMCNGYATTNMPLTIQSTGSRSITLKMISVSDPPQGTSTSKPTSVPSDQNGQVSSDVNVQTSGESSTGGGASLSINSGTGITDINGKPLTGNLTASVTYFSGNSSEAVNSLPTGLSVSVTNQSGTTGQGFVQPAAFASYIITNQNGQAASTFNTPIQLSMTVPGSTINPSTNAAIKNGDSVPIYSYNDNLGSWKYETDAKASGPDAAGNYTLTFSASHLSDWLAGWIQSGNNVYTKSLTLNITGKFAALRIEISSNNNSLYSYDINSNQAELSIDTLTVPEGAPVSIKAYNLLDCSKPLVGSLNIPDFSSSTTGTYDLNVDTGDTTAVYVDATAICQDRNPVLKIKPNGYDVYIQNSCGWVDVGTLVNGKITLYGLKLNTTYTFGIIYKDKMYSDSHIVDQTSYTFDYNLDADVCADFK